MKFTLQTVVSTFLLIQIHGSYATPQKQDKRIT
jgi:hypothetical protein